MNVGDSIFASLGLFLANVEFPKKGDNTSGDATTRQKAKGVNPVPAGELPRRSRKELG